MTKRCHSTLLIAFLLIAFTSQLLANAAMTCEFKPVAPSTHSHEHMHHHDGTVPMHDMASMNQSQNLSQNHPQNHSSTFTHHHSSADCCKLMGHCSMGGALFGIDKDKIFTFQKQSSAAEDFYSRNTPTPLVTAHYRPPISA